MSDDPLIALDKHHPALVFELQKQTYVSYVDELDAQSLNFKKTDLDALRYDLVLMDWSSVLTCTDVNDAVQRFGELVRGLLNVHTPAFRPCPKPLWTNAHLQRLKREREKALRKYTRTRCPFLKAQFKLASTRYKRYNLQRYTGYIHRTQSQLRRNPAKFWSFVKSKYKENGLPSTMVLGNNTASSSAEKCQLFAKHFASVFRQPIANDESELFLATVPTDVVDVDTFCITEDMLRRASNKLKSSYSPGPDGIPSSILKHCIYELATPLLQIFNLSMQQSVFPVEWKKSFMFPIFKKGAKRDIANYRGITSLCAGSKLLEIIINELIVFNCRSYIIPEQHGFIPGRSVTTNLLEYTTFCMDNLSKGFQVDAIYTDLKAAFDRIDHGIALKKFAQLGFSARICQWLESYLKGRKLQVKVGMSLSEEFTNQSGVPQGSNLGPILFALFFNDVAALFDGTCKLVYADDFKMFVVVESLADCYVLQGKLNMFAEWCSVNQMTLSVEKCLVISFNRKTSREVFNFNYSVGDHCLERVDCIKDLGVLLDTKLTFRNQQAAVVEKAFRQLGFMSKIAKEFDDPLCLRSLYCALVRSHLESSSVIWAPYHQSWIKRIESIQRKFVWFALRNLRWTNPLNLPPYEARCRLLGLTTLEKRREIAKAVLAAKILTSEVDAPSLLASLNATVQSRSLRHRPGFFHRPVDRSDFLRNAPLRSMCNVFNQYFHLFEFDEPVVMFRRKLMRELG